MSGLTDAGLILKSLRAAEAGGPIPLIRKMIAPVAPEAGEVTDLETKGLVLENGQVINRPIPPTNIEKRIIRFDLSVEAKNPDRQGHRVTASGWDLDEYVRNGVVLWSHQNIQLAIGKNVGIGVQGKKLVQAAQMAEHQLATDVFELQAGDFIRGWSPGFVPKKWQIREDPEPGVDFLEQRLLESSACNIPANAEALSHVQSSINPDVLDTPNLMAELLERVEQMHRKLDEVLEGKGSEGYAGDIHKMTTEVFGKLGV